MILLEGKIKDYSVEREAISTKKALHELNQKKSGSPIL